MTGSTQAAEGHGADGQGPDGQDPDRQGPDRQRPDTQGPDGQRFTFTPQYAQMLILVKILTFNCFENFKP